MKKQQIIKNLKCKKGAGFTLIELVVVMASFLFIVGGAIVIFISIIQSQKRILAQEQLLNQASYAMEYISKGLRMAKKDENAVCLYYSEEDGGDIFSGYNYLYTRPNGIGVYEGLKFINASNNNACQEFYLAIGDDNQVIKENLNSEDDDNSTLLTSGKANINYLRFSVNGTTGTNVEGIYGASEDDIPVQQPRLTLILGFENPNDEDQPEIKIQTTVSQRNLNEK
jgi:prepilin-type N-terminal cleavage/methylation domain-containing protein